jgi:hypothetical protein
MFVFLFVFEVSAVNIESVESLRLEPGEKGVMSIRVENNHNFDVSDVSLSFDFSEVPLAPYDGSAEIFIGDLDRDDDVVKNIGIIVSSDAKLGVYKIPVLIRYVDEDNNEYEKSDMVSVIVFSEPRVDVFLESPEFIVGGVADVSVRVVNKGVGDVRFLSVRLKDSEFYDVYSDEYYIGDLDSDDFDSAEFKIRLNYPLPREIKVRGEVNFYDAENKFNKKDFEFSVPIYSLEEAENLGLINSDGYGWIPIVIVLVVILALVYRIRKRRRK